MSINGDIGHDRFRDRQREMVRNRPRFRPPSAREQKEMGMQAAYDEGSKAFENGKSLSENPYSKENQVAMWNSWRDGFTDAKQSENSNE